jgi:predicted RNA-binding Zn-ribbon protein involved in translation (DUF1610 family)
VAKDRRYTQRGYQDSGGGPRDRGQPRPPAGSPAPALPQSRAVSRCAECGTLLPPLTDPGARCPKCGETLHSCKQCAHFDPGRRYECTQPIPERIGDKSARNDCGVFALRTALERATGPAAPRPDDARRAFDNLFGR